MPASVLIHTFELFETFLSSFYFISTFSSICRTTPLVLLKLVIICRASPLHSNIEPAPDYGVHNGTFEVDQLDTLVVRATRPA